MLENLLRVIAASNGNDVTAYHAITAALAGNPTCVALDVLKRWVDVRLGGDAQAHLLALSGIEAQSDLPAPLTRAILAYATGIVADKCAKYASLARKHAQLFLDFSKTRKFPPAWVQDASKIVSSTPTAATAAAARPSGPQQQGPLERWADFKSRGTMRTDALKCVSMDKLLAMSGLDGVKHVCLDVFSTVQIARAQHRTITAPMNAVYCGNPGTGKTTVACLYASLLKELSILPETADIVETSGSKLASDGLEKLQEKLTVLVFFLYY